MRLFFAIWPPAGTASALHRWAQSVQRDAGGRVTDAAGIHLTLAFLGDVPAQHGPAASSAARSVRGRAHALPIEQARYWPHNRIVWAGPRAAPSALRALAVSLAGALASGGFQLERRAFAAHVTLLRKAGAPRELPPLPEVEWPVGEFTLVRSQLEAAGARYEVLERFPLKG